MLATTYPKEDNCTHCVATAATQNHVEGDILPALIKVSLPVWEFLDFIKKEVMLDTPV